jgi:hypothetical protein
LYAFPFSIDFRRAGEFSLALWSVLITAFYPPIRLADFVASRADPEQLGLRFNADAVVGGSTDSLLAAEIPSSVQKPAREETRLRS